VGWGIGREEVVFPELDITLSCLSKSIFRSCRLPEQFQRERSKILNSGRVPTTKIEAISLQEILE
jgi:hypothetical protein